MGSEGFRVAFDHREFSMLLAAVDRIEAQARVQQSQHPYECAVEFRQLLIRNIVTQKYASRYARYSQRYAHWKSQVMGFGLDYWKLSGDLLRSLTAFKTTRGYMAGIPAGVLDSGGKSWDGDSQNPVGDREYVAKYAAKLEMGGHNQPARPLFKPTTEEYAVAGFPIKGRESLKRMSRVWR